MPEWDEELEPIEEPAVEPNAGSPAGSTKAGARSGVLIGARALTGVIGIGVAVVAIAASSFLPLPTLTSAAPSVTVTPVPSTEQLICPGSVLRLGDENGANATQTTAIGSPSATHAVTTGELESRVLAATDAGGGQGAPTLISVPAASNDGGTGIAGGQSQSVKTSDYRGFTAAECAKPSSDAWLVGGSTATGRTTLLTIANPGSVASTVTIDLYAEDGLIDAAGTSGIVVAAGSQRVLSLAGFAPSLESLAVHVTSRGGPVVANLQQSIVRGIEPGGVEIIGATAAPGLQSVIPGVVMLDSTELQSALGEDGYEDLDTVLRAYVPGTEPATVTVRIIPVDASAGDGGVDADSVDLTLDPGVVTDVTLDGLLDGSYTIVVDSSVPITTAVRASTITDGVSDLAWYAAAQALTDSSFVSIATGPSATLQLGNPGSTAATVTVADQTITVAAGASVSIPVDDGQSYLLTGAEGLFASVSYAGPGKLGTYLLGASATQEPPVVIYP